MSIRNRRSRLSSGQWVNTAATGCQRACGFRLQSGSASTTPGPPGCSSPEIRASVFASEAKNPVAPPAQGGPVPKAAGPQETPAEGHPRHAGSSNAAKHHHHHSHRRCPECGSSKVRPDHRSGPFEIWVMPLLLRRPYKCGHCSHRYHDFSTGKKTLRRAWISFVVFGLLTVAAFGARLLVAFLTERKETPEPPPPPPQ